MARRVGRQRGPGKRYTAVEKAKVLEAAKAEGLTGAQVRKRFGVSTLTFYRWRGPVRRRRRGPGRPKGSRNRVARSSSFRQHVRAEVKRVLPEVIQQEVAAYLRQILR